MTNPTYCEQFSKIVGAYLRDELRPMNSCYCFVGNILNNVPGWKCSRVCAAEIIDQHANGYYTVDEIMNLEAEFMGWGGVAPSIAYGKELTPDYEDRLYRAMERALLYLRQLHESKGEVIEDYEFKRRELVK